MIGFPDWPLSADVRAHLTGLATTPADLEARVDWLDDAVCALPDSDDRPAYDDALDALEEAIRALPDAPVLTIRYTPVGRDVRLQMLGHEARAGSVTDACRAWIDAARGLPPRDDLGDLLRIIFGPACARRAA